VSEFDADALPFRTGRWPGYAFQVRTGLRDLGFEYATDLFDDLLKCIIQFGIFSFVGVKE